MDSHAEFLRRVTLDESFVAALREGYRTAPISEAERVMLDYLVMVTEDATRVSSAMLGWLADGGIVTRSLK
jgi:hypothetical protein